MLDLLNIFFENLLPIFLAAAAGYVLSWKSDLEARHVSKVLFYIFSPALVFTPWIQLTSATKLEIER